MNEFLGIPIVEDDRVPAGRVLIVPSVGDPETADPLAEVALEILRDRGIPRDRGAILVLDAGALRAGIEAFLETRP